MQDPYEEFIDDVVCFDGRINPISGSNADFIYDSEEIKEYAKSLGMNPYPVDVI